MLAPIVRTFLAPLVLVLAFAPAARAQTGEAYCFGVGCPCGNDDPEAGCGNTGFDGLHATGALLQATGGAAYACTDSVTVAVSGMAPGQYGLVFMGSATSELPFGDGKRCVGPASGLHRFPVRQASVWGEIQEPGVVSGSQGFPGGAIEAGSTWYFQGWYRDPGGPCGSGSNLTQGLELRFLPFGADDAGQTELAGRPLPEYPFFAHVTSFNEGDPVFFGLDPSRHPGLVGLTVDVWVVEARTREQWDADPTLVDVRGSPQALPLSGGSITQNVFALHAGTLTGTTGARVGVGYDVVLDADRDGLLGPGDLIDGYGPTAGFYVVRDTSAAGPYAAQEALYSGGLELGQKVFWPSAIASLGELPLVVGNPGDTTGYQDRFDDLGRHLASYGYVVLAHQGTAVGPAAASGTTLMNADWFLSNLDTIAGGVLQGHVDSSRMVWIGRAMGAEGIVRAYTRLREGDFVPGAFSAADLRLLTCMSPSSHLGPLADPLDVDLHVWVGSADDSSTSHGAPSCERCLPYQVFERATGRRASITMQGAHEDSFLGGCGGSGEGPCQLLICPEARPIVRGYALPLLRWFVDGDPASKDFLWRQWEEFRPIGAPDTPCAVVHLELKEPANGHMIDDFQSGDLETTSSGTAKSATVTDLFQGRMRDGDATLAWDPNDPMNGMTRSRASEDSAGLVFSWSADAWLELGVHECERDFSDNAYLSFRACQMTRHPNTVAELGDLVFDVTLRDGSGGASTISIGAYGGGIGEPYQREGEGEGAGWVNEFETIRVRLSEFLTDGSGLDLTDVVAVRLEFGPSHGSAIGRMALDDVQVTIE